MVIGGLGLVPINDKVGSVLVSVTKSKRYVVNADTEELFCRSSSLVFGTPVLLRLVGVASRLAALPSLLIIMLSPCQVVWDGRTSERHRALVCDPRRQALPRLSAASSASPLGSEFHTCSTRTIPTSV